MRGQGLHDRALAQGVTLVAALTQTEGHDHLGRVHAVSGAGGLLAHAAGPLPQQPGVDHVSLAERVLPLRLRDELRPQEHVAEVLEGECGARVDRLRRRHPGKTTTRPSHFLRAARRLQ